MAARRQRGAKGEEQEQERPLRAAGYARVSTREQAEGGHSLGDQQDRIAAYCKARGWELVNTFVDAGFTGGNLDRPALRQALDLCKTGEVDALVVTAQDRLARRALDLLRLREDFGEGKVALVMLREGLDSSTPGGRFTFTCMAGAAELERDLLKERTKNGMAAAKAKGHVAGAAPYGWRREGGLLVEDKQDQKVLRELRRLRSTMSLNQLAAWFGWSRATIAYRLGYRPGVSPTPSPTGQASRPNPVGRPRKVNLPPWRTEK
jgi:site-specific DNA recombinase